jgi:BirA family biotin operon repressor/biotin-[acetyl-CoA-carboxylase] ligase
VTFDLRHFASVPSTMDVAAKLAAEGAAQGVVVTADEQTAGRGRRGAAWASPAGAGLYFSFIARPSAATLPLVTLAAGVGIRDGVAAATGLIAAVKWPNDLLVERRKLAGILAEGLSIGTPDQAVVIGVGVNVLRASYPPDVATRATSVEDELGRAFDREALLMEILSALARRLDGLERDPGDILRAWRDASPTATGTRVEFDGKHGVTAGIDEAGALLVRTPSGVERVIGGELHWAL